MGGEGGRRPGGGAKVWNLNVAGATPPALFAGHRPVSGGPWSAVGDVR